MSIALLGGALQWGIATPKPSEDAFWLAACVPQLPAATPILDAGCGSGAVGLALLARMPSALLTGIDCDATALAAATTHATLNARQVVWLHADILSPLPNPMQGQQWPVVVCNPPFHATARGHSSPNPRKNLAHGLSTLSAWVAAWHSLVSPNGQVFAVLHSHLQPELLNTLKPYGGRVRTAALASHPVRPPKRFLLSWQPNSANPFTHTPCAVVPTYHSPLRLAVLEHAQPLAIF
jgi:tRNA1(Val) A37 N6-methylase TrmN6